MKNYLIIHGSFGNPNENWFPWLKKNIMEMGYNVIVPQFPINEDQNYNNWEKVLKNLIKEKLVNEETVIITHSIASIFIVKFSLANNFKIKKLISVSGFNNYFKIPKFDEVNKTFFVKELGQFKQFCKKSVCFYSQNDPYI